MIEIMRQREDSAFSELLCRVRTDSCTSEDLAVLKSRQITSDVPDYPYYALHVYRRNVEVDKHNDQMLEALTSETSHIDLSTLSQAFTLSLS